MRQALEYRARAADMRRLAKKVHVDLAENYMKLAEAYDELASQREEMIGMRRKLAAQPRKKVPTV
jgi:hypothetical protein